MYGVNFFGPYFQQGALKPHALLAKFSGQLAFLLLAGSLWQSSAQAGDALQSQALLSDKAAHSFLMDITQAGERLVAVGERGHILYSDDQGGSWQQALVPVRVTLTALHFPTPQHGWAVGHDGVILASQDGGKRWVKQLDGIQANGIIQSALAQQVEAQQQIVDSATEALQEEAAQRLDDLVFQLEDAQTFSEEGPSRAFLDVWFKNQREGWVVGAFGLLLQTLDGGNSWHSRIDRIDNPDAFHLFSILPVGETLLLAGEAGSLYRSLDGGNQWEQLDTPYEGSFFGAAGDSSAVLAFGLQGNVFLSRDLGTTWEPLPTGTDKSLIGATRLSDDTWVLVGNNGIITRLKEGQQPRRYTGKSRGAYTALIPASEDQLLIVGRAGIKRISTNELSEEAQR